MASLPHSEAPAFVQHAKALIGSAVSQAYEDIELRYRAMNASAQYRARQRVLDFLRNELPKRMCAHRAYPSSQFAHTPPDSYLMADYAKQGLSPVHYRILPRGFCVYYHIRTEHSTKMAMEYVPIALAHTLKNLGVPVQLVELQEIPPKKKDGNVIDIGIRQAVVVLVDLRDLERIGL